jgi:hypothetical protein
VLFVVVVQNEPCGISCGMFAWSLHLQGHSIPFYLKNSNVNANAEIHTNLNTKLLLDITTAMILYDSNKSNIASVMMGRVPLSLGLPLSFSFAKCHCHFR